MSSNKAATPLNVPDKIDKWAISFFIHTLIQAVTGMWKANSLGPGGVPGAFSKGG